MSLYQFNEATKSYEPVQAAQIITNLAVAEGPWPTFWRNVRPTVTKTTVTYPGGLTVNIGNQTYVTTDPVTVDLSNIAAATRKAKDVYLYAVKPSAGIVPGIVASMNSTIPENYTADTSRKIGGVHCLCANVGTIAGHTLSGYVAGDILPASIWDLLHRAKSENEGMVFVDPVDKWFDIYLASYDGSQLRSIFGAATADGTSSVPFHGEKFNEEFAKVKKRLPLRDDFVIAAWGSNIRTNITGSKDAGTTGGHVDTAGRRMISNWGLEDCCGFLWQWCDNLMGKGHMGDGSNASTSGWGALPNYNHDSNSGNGVYHSGIDPESYGDDYGVAYRLRAGGCWADSSYCGPRSVSLHHVSAYLSASCGGRGASEPRSRFI